VRAELKLIFFRVLRLTLSFIPVKVYEEGTHLMLPWFDRPIIYDVRARPNVIQSTSGSRDLQMVGFTLAT
jgi:hypothetical protein